MGDGVGVILNGLNLNPQLITFKSEVNKTLQIIKSKVSITSEVMTAPKLNSALEIKMDSYFCTWKLVPQFLIHFFSKQQFRKESL